MLANAVRHSRQSWALTWVVATIAMTASALAKNRKTGRHGATKARRLSVIAAASA
jgi:hypothetical protein